MKTVEQINKEVNNYLTQTQKHLFKIGNDEHKIVVSGDNIIKITGKDIKVYSINSIINLNNGSSKTVLKNLLFRYPSYGKKVESIRQYKSAVEKYSKIKDVVKNKINQQEIKDDISKLI